MISIRLGFTADSLCTGTYNMVMLTSTGFFARLLAVVRGKWLLTPQRPAIYNAGLKCS